MLLHLLLEDAPHVLNRVQVILGHSITFISKAVVILVVCLGWLCWKQILKGGHNLLLQNVTVHVGIHVSLNEPQLPRTSSSHPAPDHDATTTMPDCRQGTVFLVLLTSYVRLIRPQDMVTGIHTLGQVVFSKLFAGFFCEPASEEASFWDDSHANQGRSHGCARVCRCHPQWQLAHLKTDAEL